MKPFSEVVLETIEPRTILVDVDGTLLADGEDDISPAVRAQIEKSRVRHQLFVCSNSRTTDRVRRIAADLNVPLIETPYRKPDPRVIAGISARYPILVIGDKYLTDRLFARTIGAEYLRVARLTSRNDHLGTRLVYLMDDAASFLVKSMKRRT